MNNSNFGKDIKSLTEDELSFHINNLDPKFGVLCQYELMRRLAVENSKSSEKFSRGAAYLAIVSIIISIAIGTIQIYLSGINSSSQTFLIGP